MKCKKIHVFLMILVLFGFWVRGQAQALTDDEKNNVNIYQKASPSVVNVISTVITRDFFLNAIPREGSGSGSIIDARGHVLTNNHVIRDAKKLEVTLAEGSKWPARLVGTDPDNDLAVIKIDAPADKLKPLPMGDSQRLRVGQKVLAIGNPFGLGLTLTTGIISSLGRNIRSEVGTMIEDLIQTDASINPGNSGGPLLNVNGELIGINTAIRADAQGIGFAIPVDVLTSDMPKLLDFERLNRVVLGLGVQQKRTERGDELLAASVAPDSPAAEAGCEVGDRLLALNGRKLVQLPDYQIPMLAARAGEKVKLQVLRDGKKVNLVAEMRARPKPDGQALAWRLFGMGLQELTPELVRQRELPVDRGLLVTDLASGGPARRLRIRVGDVVFRLGRWYVGDLERLGLILEDVQPGDVLSIWIVRGKVRAWGSIRAGMARGAPPGSPTATCWPATSRA